MQRIEEKRQSFSLAEAKQLFADAGVQISVAFDTGTLVYASSVESFGPATFGHPRHEVSYHRDTGWLVVR